MQVLTEEPQGGKPRAYISVYQSIGGWNSVLLVWDPELGFYEPYNTGMTNTSLGDGKRESAIDEAKSWAESEDLSLWLNDDKGVEM